MTNASYLLLIAALVFVKARVFDDVEKCLTSNAVCNKSRDCSKYFYEESCLATRINTSTNVSQIECCFSCCLQFYLNIYSLDTVSLAATRSQIHRAFPDPSTHSYVKTVLQSPFNILFSAFYSSIYLSSFIVTPLGKASAPPIQRMVAALSTASTSDHREIPWDAIQGNNVTLITPDLSQCVDLPFNMSSLSPTVGSWYSSQVLCAPIMLAPRPERDTPSTFNVIPLGAIDPSLLNAAIASAQSSASFRDVFLDCSCAIGGSRTGNNRRNNPGSMPQYVEPIKHFCHSDKAPANSRGVNASSSMRTSYPDSAPESLLWQLVREQDEVLNHHHDSLKKRYDMFQRAEYVLSLSSPSSLSSCEWEAIASGAKILLPQDLHKQLLEHPQTAELYRNLPLAAFPSGGMLTRDDIRGLVINGGSVEKAYSPYWVHRFTRGLLHGEGHYNRKAWQRSVDAFISGDTGLDKNKISGGGCPVSRPAEANRGISGELVQIIVPLCCETAHELEWLTQLARLDGVSASMYYQCPQCVPKSRAVQWRLEGRMPFSATPLGAMQMDDGPVRELGNIQQHLLLDSNPIVSPLRNSLRSPSDEFAAYLTHIVDNYHRLAPLTYFLHAAPDVHINFELFFNSLIHGLKCGASKYHHVWTRGNNSDGSRSDFLFLHLNYRYRSGHWGQCCGSDNSQTSNGSHATTCKRSLWERLLSASGPLSSLGLPGAKDERPPGEVHGDVSESDQPSAPIAKASNRHVHRNTFTAIRNKEDADMHMNRMKAAEDRRRRKELHRAKDISAGNGGGNGGESATDRSTMKLPGLLELESVSQRRQLRNVNSVQREEPIALAPEDRSVDRQMRQGKFKKARGSIETFASYSSAQFAISRSAILSLPHAAWLTLLLAVNGSTPLAGCTTIDIRGNGIPRSVVGEQYQRMWHVLFGYPRQQGYRSEDSSLPVSLRIDCEPLTLKACQQEFGKGGVLSASSKRGKKTRKGKKRARRQEKQSQSG